MDALTTGNRTIAGGVVRAAILSQGAFPLRDLGIDGHAGLFRTHPNALVHGDHGRSCAWM